MSNHYFNHYFNPFQPMNPHSPAGPFQHSWNPPPTLPAAAPNHEEFNVSWGPEQANILAHIANHMPVGGSTTGLAATANNGRYQCRWLSCQEACEDFNELMLHLGSVHDVQGSAGRELDCYWLTEGGFCGKKRLRHGFRRHIATHVHLRFPCTECDKTFSRADSKRNHEKRAHRI